MRSGPNAAARLVREVEADLVLNAIVGFAGWSSPTALENGTTSLWPTKKALSVRARWSRTWPPRRCAGAARGLERLGSLPTDRRCGPRDGGLGHNHGLWRLFRSRSRDELTAVTRDQALAHPTWSMGEKITVDLPP